MAARMLELAVPADALPRVRALLREEGHEPWAVDIDDHRAAIRILVERADTDQIIDRLMDAFAVHPSFRIALLPIDVVLPRPHADDATQPAGPARMAREELYADVARATRSRGVFLALTFLSTLVATIGLMRDEVALIIGAMVLAPLLGPNVALALATALGDGRLARRAIAINAAGVSLAFATALLVGLILPFDHGVHEIAARTQAHIGDVVLALAAGVAGALAFTTGLSSALIGVMVAVALLPPLATVALMVAIGDAGRALGALELLGINVISVNLAAVVTFYVQGVKPGRWWEADRARRSTRAAVIAWTLLLLALIVLVVVSGVDTP